MHLTTILRCIVACLLTQAVSAAGPLVRVLAQQAAITRSPSATNPLKVPGASPAYYCSDPSEDVFQISSFDFVPTNPRIGYYLTVRFDGIFTSSTGDIPWLNITGSINGRPELEPLYDSPLCDIDVFQKVSVPRPRGDHDHDAVVGFHRACPPSIQKGYAMVTSPPMPLTPQTVPVGKYELRAEAKTQDGKRIFCVEGSFDITT